VIDPQLKGKVVCLTGGNNPQGIGAATAKAFAAQGASVFIHYFRQASALSDQGKAEVESGRPGEALYLDAQTRSAAEVIRAIRREGCGRCDCVLKFRASALAHGTVALRRRRPHNAAIRM
jgi:3-oxoacyl-[acyl-carrier protein] reductase